MGGWQHEKWVEVILGTLVFLAMISAMTVVALHVSELGGH